MTPDALWSDRDLPAALAALARATGLAGTTTRPSAPVRAAGAGGLASVGFMLGLDVQAAPAVRDPSRRMLHAIVPALIPVPGTVDRRVAAVASVGRRRARLVAPDGRLESVPVRDVIDPLTGADPDVDPSASACWRVRSSPGSDVRTQIRQAHIPRQLVALASAHAAEYAFFLLSWVVLGRAAFAGRIESMSMLTWIGLLALTVPARVMATRLQAKVAINAGWLLRRRLLHGTLRLQADEIRREGVGQLLGRSLEAEAVEDLAVGGGLLGMLATVEIAVAIGVVAGGPGLRLAALLVVWVALSLAAGRRYIGRRRAWAHARMVTTHDLIEKMVGHRTRLVQQQTERWHEGEQEALDAYGDLAVKMDRLLRVLLAMAPRGWVVVGFAMLGFEAASGASSASIAVGAGGILIALGALNRLVNGLVQLADAAVAWSQVAPLFDAAARVPGDDVPAALPIDVDPTDPPVPILATDDVEFRYDRRGAAALSGCSMALDRGDRLLIEGPSGSGKSTLAALLSGLRQPSGGRVLLEGADHGSVGTAEWRRAVASSPQFHENHVVLGPLIFNLLLGRGWPPSPGDVRDAHELCIDLGLGPLVERMPSGLQQMVGESGWQLSHGERSLVFLGRALLQPSRVVVLDETFGALDPETMRRALDVALDRAETLVVIRH